MSLKVSDGIAAYIDDFQKSDAPQFKGKNKKERRDMAIAAYLTAKRGGLPQKETVRSADRKPEIYLKPDGKRGVRMVPVDKEIVKKEANNYMGEALDPNNHKHVMKVLSPTKNSVQGIAAIKKKFGVDHKKANDMMDKAIDHQTKKESIDELSMYTSKKMPNLSYPKKKTKYQQEKDRINMMKKNKQKGESVTEETNFAVSIEGLPTMFMSADSPGMLKQTLRKIVKQPSMIKAVKRVTDAAVKKTFRLKAQGREEDQE